MRVLKHISVTFHDNLKRETQHIGLRPSCQIPPIGCPISTGFDRHRTDLIQWFGDGEFSDMEHI